MIRKPSLNDRIQSLTSLEEVEGYLLGIAMQAREVLDLEATLLERRIASLAASVSVGAASRPSLHPDALRTKLAVLRRSQRLSGVCKNITGGSDAG